MIFSVILADGTFPCSTAPLQGAYSDVIPEAAAIGYQAVQLTVNRPEDVPVEQLKKLLAENQLHVSALATGMGYTVDGLSLGAGNESQRQKAVARMCGHIDLAAQLDGAMVIIGAIRGRTEDADSPEAYYDSFHQSVKELVEYAEKKNVVILLEANDHLETDAYIRIDETAEYIRSLNSPNLRLQLDVMHMIYESESIVPAVENTVDILAQVDISEVDRSCPGTGSFDYPLLMEELKKIDFQGYLTFEYRAEPKETAARDGFNYITSLLK